MNKEVEKSPYYLRITATPECNFRCPYCNPDGTFTPGEMSDQEVLGALQAALNKGVDKIHWTGGEPTIRRGMLDLVAEAKRLGFSYQAMTTNGLRFDKDAELYRDAGLIGVSISLDSLQRDRVIAMSGGRNALKSVYNAIVKSCELFPEVVVNTVVTPDNVDEIPDFIEFAKKMNGRFIPRFCELQNFGPAYSGQAEKFARDYISRNRILEILQQLGELEDLNRTDVDKYNAHAEYFKMSADGLIVGVIAPYANGWPCAGKDCGRIRIGPTGIVKSCIQSPNYELSGKSQQEREMIFEQVILEKNQRIESNHFPAHHVPAYQALRFGIKNR